MSVRAKSFSMTMPWIDLGHELRLGVDGEGTWAVNAGSQTWPLSVPDDYYRLVILLERPYPDVSHLIDSYCAVAHRDFPIELVVRAGLIFQSDYWADLALVWLPALSPKRRVTLADALRTVSSARWARQRTRQRANRELRRLPLQ